MHSTVTATATTKAPPPRWLVKVRELWNWLVRINSADPVRAVLNRGFAMLLTSILLINALSVMVQLFTGGAAEPDFLVSLAAFVVGIFAWWLNRRGTIWGSLLLAIFAAIGVAYGAPPLGEGVGGGGFGPMWIVPVLIATLFVRPQAGIWVLLIQVFSYVLMLFVNDVSFDVARRYIFLATLGLLVTTTVMMVGTSMFQRALKASIAAQRELEDLNLVLEQRVTERTRDLKLAADVSRQATTVLDLDTLLPYLVAVTADSFKLDEVAVFLYDEPSRLLKLRASATEKEGYRPLAASEFALDADSLIARVGREQATSVANEAQQSELGVPMLVGTHLIGVLHMQSGKSSSFTPENIEILTTLAEQMAIAVRNAQLFEKAESARAAAEKANQIKSQFLASMSHELRTPLNAILNFNEMMSLGMIGTVTAEQVDVLNKSLDSGRHLLNLINDVLDVSKMQSGMLTLFVEQNINLYDILQSVFTTTQTLVKNKPVTIVQDFDPDLPLISGDKRRIRQVLLNLIANAAKFTEEGTITISATRREHEILFAVLDTGPGIAHKDTEIIFEPFIQTETGVKHQGGTGLGLPISKRLVEAHGGRMWLESEAGSGTSQTGGASFFFSLPLTPAPAAV